MRAPPARCWLAPPPPAQPRARAALPAPTARASPARRRHEYYLAARLGIQPSDSVLDCGCGIGGPLRNLGRFTGAPAAQSLSRGRTLLGTLPEPSGRRVDHRSDSQPVPGEDDLPVSLLCSAVLPLLSPSHPASLARPDPSPPPPQVDRGNGLCAKAGLAPRCKLVKADFHKLPFPDNSFDHVYSIEAQTRSLYNAPHTPHALPRRPSPLLPPRPLPALPPPSTPPPPAQACCHSPDRADVYREIYRVLKPGGCFVSYEWCEAERESERETERERESRDPRVRAEAVQIDDRRLLLLLRRCLTKKHRDGDAQHMLSKKLIEEGDGLPDMMSTTHCDDSLVKVGVQIVETPPLSSPSNPLFLPPTKVGFQVVETRDAALDPNPGGEAWYVILTPSFFNLFRLQFTAIGAPPRAHVFLEPRALALDPPPPARQAHSSSTSS